MANSPGAGLVRVTVPVMTGSAGVAMLTRATPPLVEAGLAEEGDEDVGAVEHDAGIGHGQAADGAERAEGAVGLDVEGEEGSGVEADDGHDGVAGDGGEDHAAGVSAGGCVGRADLRSGSRWRCCR